MRTLENFDSFGLRSTIRPTEETIISITRSEFVKDSTITAIGTGLALSAGPLTGKVLGANDKIIVGVMGCVGQGRWNMRGFCISRMCKSPRYATSTTPRSTRPWK